MADEPLVKQSFFESILYGALLQYTTKKKHTSPTVKHLQILLTWGAMSAKSTADLYFLLSRFIMNGSKHGDLSNQKLEFHIDVHSPQFLCTIKLFAAASGLQSNFQKLSTSKCLTGLETSDLFPKENFCSLLKNKVFKRSSASLVAMKNAVCVKDILLYYSLNLVITMTRRLQAVSIVRMWP